MLFTPFKEASRAGLQHLLSYAATALSSGIRGHFFPSSISSPTWTFSRISDVDSFKDNDKIPESDNIFLKEMLAV